MPTPRKQFKFSGRIAPQDQFHQFTTASAAGNAPDEHYLAPTTIGVWINVPSPPTLIGVPQYSPTVVGGGAAGYDPAGDCEGNFMSYKFQPNNNCYAYGCNIATNSFPQPGRYSGYLLPDVLGETVQSYAVNDGLVAVGNTMEAVLQYQQANNPLEGHFVALMVSPAGDDPVTDPNAWTGDYHWARCDNSTGGCDSWSQKDGSDQVTNFDFAGVPITDPSTASWSVNQGPNPGTSDQVVEYAFYCFMYVPPAGVNII